jgi:hypothetical protein
MTEDELEIVVKGYNAIMLEHIVERTLRTTTNKGRLAGRLYKAAVSPYPTQHHQFIYEFSRIKNDKEEWLAKFTAGGTQRSGTIRKAEWLMFIGNHEEYQRDLVLLKMFLD